MKGGARISRIVAKSLNSLLPPSPPPPLPKASRLAGLLVISSVNYDGDSVPN